MKASTTASVTLALRWIREIDELCSTWAEYEELPLETLLQIVGVAGYILPSIALSEESLLYSPNERTIRRPSIE